MSIPQSAGTDPSTCDLPFVTIVMPIWNERRWIKASLGSALAIDYPAERYEVLAIDGISDDGTREILADLATRHPRLRVVDSTKKRQAFALNRGIRLARGDIIVRMDAHTIYPQDYVRRCVRTLLETQADNVGGICITVPGAPTAMGRAIARALSVGFGVGNVAYRVGAKERRWVDTVPFGCWRKDTLIRLGGFATDLAYAEDDELNARLRRRGGRILLDPAISARYIARPTLLQLARMLWRYGHGKPLAQRRIGRITTARQLAPPAFVVGLAGASALAVATPAIWPLSAGLLAAHFAVGIICGLRDMPAHGFQVAIRLPLIFLVMHVAYGLGYLWGVFALLRDTTNEATPRSRAEEKAVE